MTKRIDSATRRLGREHGLGVDGERHLLHVAWTVAIYAVLRVSDTFTVKILCLVDKQPDRSTRSHGIHMFTLRFPFAQLRR